MHADHIKPRALGGSDDVTNCRILKPKSNMAKGKKHHELREWQQRFLDKWEQTSGPFLLTAIPGGGKTIAALEAARRFLDGANSRRLIIVVPTVNLQEQWRQEATAFGIHLQTQDITCIKEGFDGCVVTYQSLDALAQYFRKVCSVRQILTILDEPHHCGDKASWGNNAKVAFELSYRILLLSGTPFRTDGQPIPFVPYDGGGTCVPDDRYDYPDALRDGVVRYLTFDYAKGDITLLTDGVEANYEFTKEISEEEAARRLRFLLNPSGEFVQRQLSEAHARLLKIRQSIPDAAGIAVCIDQQHAVAVAKVLEGITGRKPAVIVSDEDKATNTVKAFRSGDSEWVVSVKQVSEGTDIKRLQVLCYLTTATTEIFFRQLIGRVSRVRYREDPPPTSDALDSDREAFVFLPADPRLVKHATTLEEMQLHAIKQENEEHLNAIEKDPSQSPLVFFLASSHMGTDALYVGQQHYSAVDGHGISHLADRYGITTAKAAKLYEDLKAGRLTLPSTPTLHSPAQAIPKEEILNKLRRQCHSVAFRLSKILDVHVQEIHKAFKPQSEMSQVELEAKLIRLMACIRSQSMP